MNGKGQKQPHRLPGWIIPANPIFRRYCRSRLRPAGLSISLLIVVMLAGFIVAMAKSVGVGTELSPEDAARGAIIPLLMLQAFILFVVGTAQASGGMVTERDEGVIDYQRLIPMRPLEKVLGYLFGLPVREYVVVAATLPFSAWCFWKGEVAASTWFPLYLVLFSSALTYHFTGMVTGMVVKNRRWAFLVSIGLVFCLYTVFPQMAKFGLVFFEYLTIFPVFDEQLPGILPKTASAMLETGRNLAPTVKFFGLDFSETVFTLFSQGGLILTFGVMLCRRWRRAESHLLGKPWAAGLFAWIQILLLGNALPLIEPGLLFPSRAFSRIVALTPGWQPEPLEAVAMSAVYGFATMMLLFILISIITPSRDRQARGWRHAKKHGAKGVGWISEPATAWWFTLLMALAGAAGWYWFTKGLVESRWFPGQVLSPRAFGFFALVLVATGLVFQTILESKGGKALGLCAIFLGALPLMAGAVLAVLGKEFSTLSIWAGSLSPLSLPLAAATTLMPAVDLPVAISRGVPRAFYFWLAVLVLAAIRLSFGLWAARRKMAREALEPPAAPPLPPD